MCFYTTLGHSEKLSNLMSPADSVSFHFVRVWWMKSPHRLLLLVLLTHLSCSHSTAAESWRRNEIMWLHRELRSSDSPTVYNHLHNLLFCNIFRHIIRVMTTTKEVVFLSVAAITQKLLNQCGPNLLEAWALGLPLIRFRSGCGLNYVLWQIIQQSYQTKTSSYMVIFLLK